MKADVQPVLVGIYDAEAKLMDTCAGPDPHGDCPRRVGPLIPCEGLRVIPLRGTEADGLPFTVPESEWDRCPLAWFRQSEGSATDRQVAVV